ncbi:MAG: peptidoglycan editing factor PgeF [Alcaligenaceae bacterium]|nr:peptidoglycan editing factor PgeF [Alcaligenaceae bacterium]
MGELTRRQSASLVLHGAPWKGVSYGCTTRAGGVSAGPWESLNLALHVGDDPLAVQENRRRLAAGLPAEPFWLEQVHGRGVVEVTGPFTAQPAGGGALLQGEGAANTPPQADAAITTQPGVVLAIMTADCIPVVMADAHGRALGVAHAGWRGLAAGVLEATLAALRARLPEASAWRAWIGPCIGQQSFEVGDEVRVAFTEQDPDAQQYFTAGRQAGKWQADIAALARHRLLTIGLYDVEVSGLCTYQRADLFYSYRRSAASGRMATLAWLHGPELP